jgi:hypothetical protein
MNIATPGRPTLTPINARTQHIQRRRQHDQVVMSTQQISIARIDPRAPTRRHHARHAGAQLRDDLMLSRSKNTLTVHGKLLGYRTKSTDKDLIQIDKLQA